MRFIPIVYVSDISTNADVSVLVLPTLVQMLIEKAWVRHDRK